MKLTNDIDAAQVKRIFELLREETLVFAGMTLDEVTSLQNVFRVLNFRR